MIITMNSSSISFSCMRMRPVYTQSALWTTYNVNSLIQVPRTHDGKRRARVFAARAQISVQVLVEKSLSIAKKASSQLKSSLSKYNASATFSAIRDPIVQFKLSRDRPVNFAVGLGIIFLVVAITIRRHMANQFGADGRGSVSDLIKRGQLRSDRRNISQSLKYDDPFNNPMMRVNEKSLTMKMCGKIFRLAPVTLTEDEAASHQNRRMRAYQWKRPTLFLKEGEPIPAGIDPDTVRWVPANHPFATTIDEIDENLAQRNIYQKRGVPSRVRAEHEALQRKMSLEASNNDSNLTPMVGHAATFPSQSDASNSSEKPSNHLHASISHNDSKIEGLDGGSSESQALK